MILLFFLAGASVSAAVLTIDNTQSIQTAVNTLASSGDASDTLILNPGAYSENGITLGKNIRIQANTSFGHSATDTIIDGTSTAPRIFTAVAGISVAIDNLTLQNGRGTNLGTDTDNGGAIRISGGTLTITSSAFSGCRAGLYGGAIYTDGGNTASVVDSTFLNCQADSDGGAILSDTGTLDISTSSFTSCSATNGGAVRSTGILSVVSSGFFTCSATNLGGAIRSSGTATIAGSSTFTGCTALWGGAIQVAAGTLDITGATFSGCTANTYGGAIFNTGTLTLTSSTFSGCSAREGGAIYNNGGTVIITGSTFSSCSTSGGGDGGAILQNGGALTITSTMFSACTVSGSGAEGGAIAIPVSSTVTILSSSFIDCSATYYGGAIQSRAAGTDLSVTGSTFWRCTSSAAGAIFTSSNPTTISSSLFSYCSAHHGGAIIVWDPGNAGIDNTTFSYCSDLTDASAIETANYGSATITSSTFSGGSSVLGGVIHAYRGPVTIHFSRIVNNTGPYAIVSYDSTVDATNNWWGTNDDPSPHSHSQLKSVTAAPWLVLGITASPASISTAGTSTIRTNLTYNSNNLAPAGGYVPDAITNTYAMVTGSGSVSPLTGGTVNGVAQTTFTSGYSGTVNISGTVDDQTVYIELPVTQGTPGVTGITPNTGINTTSIAITNLAGSSFTIVGTTTVNLTRAGHANITATGVTVVSPTRITCTLPITGAEAGRWNVVVVNPDGREAVLSNGFTITAPAPVPTATVTESPTEDPGILSDFPSAPNPPMTVTVNIGGDSKAWQAIVTGTNLRDLIVTGTEQHGPFGSCNPPAGSLFQYLGLEPARYGTITNAVIHFTVPQSWLEANRIDPKSIVLYHMTPNCWQPLPTTFLDTKDGIAYFSGQSTGFSSFAIAGTPVGPVAVAPAVPQESVSMPVTEQETIPLVTTKAPATTQTKAPPAPDQAPAKSAPFPFVPVLAVLCCIGLIGGGWYARRWWIRRQNPGLFREYD